MVHAPRCVTKPHTTATDTMVSVGAGPIAAIDDCERLIAMVYLAPAAAAGSSKCRVKGESL
jgi:L-asparaginase/Glu-tRNA(Gln) amidotransferase subunit D